jgi:uncharacterized protein (DUF924 family)
MFGGASEKFGAPLGVFGGRGAPSSLGKHHLSSSIMTVPVDDILEFWLNDVGAERWYVQDNDLDAVIRARFEQSWLAASSQNVSGWVTSAKSALAFLILLDQFPRNMFRGTASAFASDATARAVAKLAVDRRYDVMVPEPERQFFYLPLMHAENLQDQERCVRLILLRMPEHGGNNLPHAIKHREVIRRFGRFPSRNAALGRDDSPAERAYRAEGGYMS